MKEYKHLKYDDRIKIEALIKEKCSAAKIAKHLKCSRNTVYNELKRGKYERLTGEYVKYISYSADIAQVDYDYKATAKGTPLKIGNDYKFVKYVEDKIVNEKYSPDAIIGEIKKLGLQFRGMVCTSTIYNYINAGDVFANITRESLYMKGKRKKKYDKIRRIKKISKGLGLKRISERPDVVEKREDVGHWEMDTVKGKRGGSTQTLLVLTERKTRYEIIRKLPDSKQESVAKILDELERQTGSLFSYVFKSIAVDNGSEFLNDKLLEKSVRSGKRTDVYYCHPYSSWERGSNENLNKMIRRFIPKGENLKKYTKVHIKKIQEWINHYPRRILDYESSAERFKREIGFLVV